MDISVMGGNPGQGLNEEISKNGMYLPCQNIW